MAGEEACAAARCSALNAGAELMQVRADPLAGVLASSLPSFSLDIVKVIRNYLVATATPNAKPPCLLGWGSGDAPKSASFDVACSPDGKIWLSAGKVQVFSAEGKFLHEAAKERREDTDAAGSAPLGIAFASNGEAYIADGTQHRIMVCRPDGNVIRRFGSRDGRYGDPDGVGTFLHPHYVAVDRQQGLVFVTEKNLDRVQVVRLDGSFVRSWRGRGTLNGIAIVTAAGEVAVTDDYHHSVQVRVCVSDVCLQCCRLRLDFF